MQFLPQIIYTFGAKIKLMKNRHFYSIFYSYDNASERIQLRLEV